MFQIGASILLVKLETLQHGWNNFLFKENLKFLPSQKVSTLFEISIKFPYFKENNELNCIKAHRNSNRLMY